ncbi:MAG: hypothetical protein H7A24_16155 [Leptospiraceae bacterium]|nr:hypothetical protein [Leptospiraceae bacterium]MCP5513421.1 hypothetical protein [Leptospiraceae bacterium]
MEDSVFNPNHGISPKKILLIHSDLQELSKLSKLISEQGHLCTHFQSIEKAMNFLKSGSVDILFCENSNFDFSNKKTILELKKYNPLLIIILLSKNEDLRYAIKCIQNGIFEYITLPYTTGMISEVLRNASEEYNQNKLIRQMKEEEEKDHTELLRFQSWKDTILKDDREEHHNVFLDTISNGLIQSAGIGSVSTLITLLKSTAEEKDGKLEIDKNFFDLLFQASEQSVRMCEYLTEINDILKGELQMETASVNSFHEKLKDLCYKLEELSFLKGQMLFLSEYKPDSVEKHIHIDLKLILRAVEELLINTLKFSTIRSTVYILLQHKHKEISLTLINSPSPEHIDIDSIDEYELKSIVNPFQRFSKIIQEKYNSFDLGLGLTFVEKVMIRHGGRLVIKKLKNHINANHNSLLEVTVYLPIQN